MQHPFLLLIAANLALVEFLGWKVNLRPVPTWLAVQQSRYVFFLILYDSIIDIIYWWTVWITPQLCQSHLCCWLLPIWIKLDVSAENGAYGLCLLGWRYNGAKMYFPITYMIVSMILNSSEISASHLSGATAIFVLDCWQFGPTWIFGLKMDLMAYVDLLGGTTEKIFILPDLIW